jgi:periplasmic protein CpxP/Spy
MEITSTSEPNHQHPTVKNQLVKLLPLLAIVIAAPAFAGNYFNHNSPHGQIASGGMGKRADKLNLTTEQKTKIEQLRTSTSNQIDAVLTPEQRQKFAQIKSQRQANRQSANGMNLTAEQKNKLKAIRQANKVQFKAMLTPAQQTQLSQGGGWGKGLNLTAEQKTKMVQLRTAARAEMNTVLTPAQQQQAQARYGRRQAIGSTWQSLNLTADQQAKITTIRQSSQQQLKIILTPEQQAKWKSHRRHGGRHNSV